MFNVSRRGPASISRVFRAAASTARIPSTRPSTLYLSNHIASKPALEARWLHISPQLWNQALARDAEGPSTGKQYPTITKFDELLEHDLVHPNIVNAITKGMGHETMTEVQSMTINQGLQGNDMLVSFPSWPLFLF
jgi:ATP-dependent RNA helicase MSS116